MSTNYCFCMIHTWVISAPTHFCSSDERSRVLGKIGAVTMDRFLFPSGPHAPPAVRNTTDCVTARADLAIGTVPGDAPVQYPAPIMSIICDPLTRLTRDFLYRSSASFHLLTHLTVRTASCAVMPRRIIRKASTSVADLLIPWWQCTNTRPETTQ